MENSNETPVGAVRVKGELTYSIVQKEIIEDELFEEPFHFVSEDFVVINAKQEEKWLVENGPIYLKRKASDEILNLDTSKVPCNDSQSSLRIDHKSTVNDEMVSSQSATLEKDMLVSNEDLQKWEKECTRTHEKMYHYKRGLSKIASKGEATKEDDASCIRHALEVMESLNNKESGVSFELVEGTLHGSKNKKLVRIQCNYDNTWLPLCPPRSDLQTIMLEHTLSKTHTMAIQKDNGPVISDVTGLQGRPRKASGKDVKQKSLSAFLVSTSTNADEEDSLLHQTCNYDQGTSSSLVDSSSILCWGFWNDTMTMGAKENGVEDGGVRGKNGQGAPAVGVAIDLRGPQQEVSQEGVVDQPGFDEETLRGFAHLDGQGKGSWCIPYVPFERKTTFCMTKSQAHEVYNLPNSGVDARLLTEADFTSKDWLKCFKEVPKRGSKVKCREVKPELWNMFYVLFTSMYQEPPVSN
ncbi:hypothetical protein L7F22_050342 [Adiantum nelumboides]|nr:hypothetical protein [Adiantum nelumboides]